MSTLESVIWHILGYITMPMIFVVGFVGVSLVSMWILRFFTPQTDERHDG